MENMHEQITNKSEHQPSWSRRFFWVPWEKKKEQLTKEKNNFPGFNEHIDLQ